MEQNGALKRDEQIAVQLRMLYQTYGYLRYKMNKFEEYDFYAENKDFLVSKEIITFTDTSGKLMALKPDVTLSIIKNCREQSGYVQKVYYQENVYRVSSGTRNFKEIMQSGLECVGELGIYDVCETVLLAALSLQTIAKRWTLDLSHMGILSGVMDRWQISAKTRHALMSCLRRKSVDEIRSVCREAGLQPDAAETLEVLCQLYAPLEEGIDRLERICPEQAAALAELRAVGSVLQRAGCGNIHLDFSIVNDMEYYSGITFQGFVEGIPDSLLSGGAYGNLMRKMGKQGGGIGFAVYLDQLERYGLAEKPYDVDTLLLYDTDARPEDVASAVRTLAASGATVLAERMVPESLRFRLLLKLKGKEIECVAGNG